MSKNLIRKGLAFGALVALGSSVVAGAPAYAANELSIAPIAGTSYNTLVTEQFELATSYAAGVVPAAWTQLRYQITTDGVATILATSSATAGTAATGSLSLNSSNVADIAASNTGATARNVLGLKVSGASSTTASTAVNVVAYVDSNNSGAFDSGDTWNTAATVNFKKYSEVTATTAITAPFEADTTATAKIAFDGINNEQLSAAKTGATFTKGDDSALTAADVATVSFSVTGNVATLVTASQAFVAGQKVTISGVTTDTYLNGTYTISTRADATHITFPLTHANEISTNNATGTVSAKTLTHSAWSATDKFKYVATSAAALVKGQAVKVQAVYNGVNVGTAATAAITARTVSALTADSVVSTTQNASEEVALNKAFSVYAKTVDTSSPAVAIEGKTVEYSVSASALPNTAADVTSSTATLTINGVTYTNEAALPGATGVAKLSGVTNADGKIFVSGSSAGLANNETIVFSFSAENFVTALTLTEKTIAPTAAYITSYEGNAAAVVSGSSVSVNIAAYDQFGGAIADGYDARAVWASSSRSTTSTTNATAAVVTSVVSGKATLVLADGGAGTGTNVWNISLIKRSTTAGGYTGVSDNIGALDFAISDEVTAFTVNFKAAADLVAGEIVLKDSASTDLALNTAKTKYVYTANVAGGATTKATLATEDFGSYDARGVIGTVPAPTGNAVLKGVVKSASTSTYAGVAIPGTTVTLASAGLQFKASQGGANVWTTNSITVNVDASGAFSVAIYSQVAGARTVTVTSGAATSVVDLNFAAAATSAGTVVAVTPDVTDLQSGTGVTFGATVVDEFGNAVAPNSNDTTTGNPYFSLKVTDLSGIASTVYAVTADAGSLSKVVNFGVNDKGTVTVVATYDADGSTTTKDAVVKTVTFNVSDLAKAAAEKAAAEKAAADAKAAAEKAAADAKAAAELAAKAKTVTATVASSTSQTGRAVDVSVKVINNAGTAGAGRTVIFTSTGAGSLTAYSAVTDANGVANVKLLAGAADNGDAVVTASVDGVVASSGTVTFGTTDAQIDIVSNRVTAVASFSKGKTVALYVDGIKVWSKLSTSDADVVLNYNLKKGAHTVTVLFSDGSATTEKFNVK